MLILTCFVSRSLLTAACFRDKSTIYRCFWLNIISFCGYVNTLRLKNCQIFSICVWFFSAQFWCATVTGASVQQRHCNWCWSMTKNLIQFFVEFATSSASPCLSIVVLYSSVLFKFFILFLHWSKSLLWPCSFSFFAMSSILFLTAPSNSSCTSLSPDGYQALTSFSDHKLPQVALEASVVYFDLTSTHLQSKSAVHMHTLRPDSIQFQPTSWGWLRNPVSNPR